MVKFNFLIDDYIDTTPLSRSGVVSIYYQNFVQRY